MQSTEELYGYFGPLGIAAAVYIALKFLLALVSLFRLYVWPRISQADLTSYGRWAVVTGGSDGIGKGYTIELAKRGVNVCVISNDENGIVSDIKKSHPVECRWIYADFSSTDVYSKIEKDLADIIDDVGILVNNVGMLQRKMEAVSAQSGEFLQKIVNVNVMSTVMMTRMVLKRMVKKNRGLIVNMGSISSVLMFPWSTLYSSTKGFLETYSCCLAAELRHTNVQIKCLQPWFVKTQLIKGFAKTNDFIGRYFPWTLPDPKSFAASAAATFGHSTPVLYNGYWSHSLIQLLTPYSLLGKQRMATVTAWFTDRIAGDVPL